MYDSDAGDASPLSDLHQPGKAVGSRVAEVGNGAHYESADEGCNTLVESTDPDPLDLSRDQVHSEGEEVKHEDMEEELPAERKSTGDSGYCREGGKVPVTRDVPSRKRVDGCWGPCGWGFCVGQCY